MGFCADKKGDPRETGWGEGAGFQIPSAANAMSIFSVGAPIAQVLAHS